MSIRGKCVRALSIAALALNLVAAAMARADLPQDPRERLEKLDQALLEKQMALFAARQSGDDEAIERAKTEFEEVQRQRGPLLEAARDLY